MNSKTSSLVFALILLMQTGLAQWIQTNGPYAETQVTAIIPTDSLLMVATDCGYFTKNQLTENWSLSSLQTFVSHTLSGNQLFIGTMYYGLKRIDLNNPGGDPVQLNTAVDAYVLAHSDSCLYAGNDEDGFLKSNDGGISWNSFNMGLPSDTLWNPWIGTYYETRVYSIVATNNYIFCGTDKGVYRSTGNLSAWDAMNNGLPIAEVSMIKEIGSYLYASVLNQLFISTDSGDSWDLLYNAPSSISSVLKHNENLYISTVENGIEFSTDQGSIWNSLNAGLDDHKINMIMDYNNVLTCGSSISGFYTFQNNQWQHDQQGMICSFIRSLAHNTTSVFANDSKNIFFMNEDQSWTNVSPVVTNDVFLNLQSMDEKILISNYYLMANSPYKNQSIYYTSDQGSTWLEINPLPYTSVGDNTEHTIYIHNDRIYAYSDEYIFYSDNMGADWTDISLPSQYCNSVYDLLVFNSVPFAATCGYQELLKLDENSNWVLSNIGLPDDRNVEDLAICDDVLFAYVLVEGMYASYDNGNSWELADSGLDATDFGIRDYACYNSSLFVSTENGIFFTSNFGNQWYECNTGLTNRNTSGLKVMGDVLYAGTYGSGIWKQPIEDISLLVPPARKDHQTLNISPNPASGSVTVTSATIEKGVLRICDLTGKIVLEKTFEPNIKLDISGIQKGTYLVSLYSDKQILISKLIVVN